MVEVKVQCGCGAKYKFDVETVNGLMPAQVHCPTCGQDGTAAANAFLQQNVSAPVAVAAPLSPVASKPGLRLAGATAQGSSSAPVERPPTAPTTAGYSGPTHRGLLERTTFFIRERAAVLKLTDTYDILDPATSQQIGIAREEPPTWAKWLRLAINKQQLPTSVNIYEADGQPPVLSIHRGFTFLRSKVRVVAGDGRSLGYFKSKLISIGGGFNVFDDRDQQVAEVKGNWKGWDFKFVSKSGREIGSVTKKWAGLAKELFTTADNYVISLNDLSGTSPAASALLLAAGLAIDVVFKEGK